MPLYQVGYNGSQVFVVAESIEKAVDKYVIAMNAKDTSYNAKKVDEPYYVERICDDTLLIVEKDFVK